MSGALPEKPVVAAPKEKEPAPATGAAVPRKEDAPAASAEKPAKPARSPKKKAATPS